MGKGCRNQENLRWNKVYKSLTRSIDTSIRADKDYDAKCHKKRETVGCFKRHTMMAYQGNTGATACPLNALW